MLRLRNEAVLQTNWSDESKNSEKQVPAWLIQLVHKCLQKKPADRFANGMKLQQFIDANRAKPSLPNNDNDSRHTEVFNQNKWLLQQKQVLEKSVDQYRQLVESKENDLDELKKILARKDAELMQWQRQKTSPGKLSSGMLALLLLLFAVGAYAAYTYISHKVTPVKKTAESAKNSTHERRTNDTALVRKVNTATTKPNRASKQNTAKKDTERSETPQTNAEKPSVVVTAESKNTQQEPAVQATNTSYEEPAKPRQKVALYTVNDKAFFYTEPDESTRRNAFIVKWNNAVLAALNDKPGFIYVVYTNAEGQTSRGWLRKADLNRVDQ